MMTNHPALVFVIGPLSLFQIDHRKARRNLLRDLIQGDSGHSVGPVRHDRLARIAAFSHTRIKRHAAKEW